MPKRTTDHSLLASFQRAAIKTVAAMDKEITRRERELVALKAEAARWQTVLQGPARGRGLAVSAPRREPRSKRPRLDWDAIFKKLPPRFTSKDIAQKASKPIAHAYTYVSRWMKDKKVRKVKDGYQKVSQAG